MPDDWRPLGITADTAAWLTALARDPGHHLRAADWFADHAPDWAAWAEGWLRAGPPSRERVLDLGRRLVQAAPLTELPDARLRDAEQAVRGRLAANGWPPAGDVIDLPGRVPAAFCPCVPSGLHVPITRWMAREAVTGGLGRWADVVLVAEYGRCRCGRVYVSLPATLSTEVHTDERTEGYLAGLVAYPPAA